MAELPGGTVTFLFTDVEGSTALWEAAPDSMRLALTRHDALVAAGVERHGGVVVKSRGEGDSIFAVFGRARDGVAAAADVLEALHAEPWPTPSPIRVRMALHTGEADLRDGDYYGGTVNRAARLRAVGHGGQALLSLATEQLARDRLPAGRDAPRSRRASAEGSGAAGADLPTRLPGLTDDARPLRTLDFVPNNLPTQLTSFVGREREIAAVRRLLEAARLLTLIGAGRRGQDPPGAPSSRPTCWRTTATASGWSSSPPSPTRRSCLRPSRRRSVCAKTPGRPLLAVLGDYLHDRQLLLILDNCEHLVGAVRRPGRRALRACPQLRILATSREALGIAGETTWRVPSLLAARSARRRPRPSA